MEKSKLTYHAEEVVVWMIVICALPFLLLMNLGASYRNSCERSHIRRAARQDGLNPRSREMYENILRNWQD